MTESSVEIKEIYLKKLPFDKIPSRLPTAIILAYFDLNEVVISVMLRLSHRSRAYIHNEGGLRGFLVDYLLLGALTRPGIEAAMRW